MRDELLCVNCGLPRDDPRHDMSKWPASGHAFKRPIGAPRSIAIANTLHRLDAAMHAHCRQDPNVDAESLTEVWRCILEDFAVRVLS